MADTNKNNNIPEFPFPLDKLQKEIGEAISQASGKSPEKPQQPEKESLRDVLKRIKESSPGEQIFILPSNGIFYPNKKPTRYKLRLPTGFDLEKISSSPRIIDISKDLPEEIKKLPVFSPEEDWRAEVPLDILLLSLIGSPLEDPSFPLEELVIGDALLLSVFATILTWGTSFPMTCPDGHSFAGTIKQIPVTLLEEKDLREEKQEGEIFWKVSEDGLASFRVPSLSLRFDFRVPRLKDRELLTRGKISLVLIKNLEKIYLIEGDSSKEIVGSLEEKYEALSLLKPREFSDLSRVLLSLSGVAKKPVKYGVDSEEILAFPCPVCNKKAYFYVPEVGL